MQPDYSTEPPVVVDLDGTLVNSDLLVENLFLFLRLHPLQCWRVLLWLCQGKAYCKRRLADTILPAAHSLPYNQPLLHWLQQQRQAGVRLVLATASDERIARQVANHLGIFDEVIGTQTINLSAENKRDCLVQRYGEGGYQYVGNALADYTVWQSAATIHIANPHRGVLAATRPLGKMGRLFASPTAYCRGLFRALRLHQWVKNSLLFVPLLASHRLLELPLLLHGLIALLSFGLTASSVYLLNDLLDLPEDRQHPTKCHRPLAAGTFPILHALLLIPGLLLSALLLAYCCSPRGFWVTLAVYYGVTVSYSLRLKRVAILDVITLALLYSLRVVAGAAAMRLVITDWVIAFCLFIFLSLALIKRYTELYQVQSVAPLKRSAGRGYYPADLGLLVALGSAAGYSAVLILALYIHEVAGSPLYRSPQWLWAACPLLLFWLSRVWLLAYRGQMPDDPVVFALRDPTSRYIGIAFIMAFILGSFG